MKHAKAYYSLFGIHCTYWEKNILDSVFIAFATKSLGHHLSETSLKGGS